MVQREITIKNRAGLHTRPAAALVKTAARFKADFVIRKDTFEINGKSIIGLMMLAAGQGSLIEVLAKGPDAIDQPIRLGGQVAPNSVKWDAETLDLRFTMQDVDGSHVEVHAKKAPPQMFREGIGVVVEGKYLPSGVFESNNLMVKHSNEYRAPEAGHDPKEMLKTLQREAAG